MGASFNRRPSRIRRTIGALALTGALVATALPLDGGAEAVANTVRADRTIADAELVLKPALDGDRIVYVRRDDSIHAVWLKDLNTGATRKLSDDDSFGAYAPDIHGNRVVWEETFRRGSVIALHDLETGETRALTLGPHDYAPSLWGDTLIWTRERHFNAWLMLMDLRTEETVTLVRVSCGTTSDLFEHTVVYCSGGDIYTIDLRSGEHRVLIESPQYAEFPALYGDVLAYAQWDDVLSRIHLLNMRTGDTVVAASAPGCVYAPALSHDRLAWEEYTRPASTEIKVARTPAGFTSEEVVASSGWLANVGYVVRDGLGRLMRLIGSVHAVSIVVLVG